MDKIFLKGLRFYACHGVYPEEKKRQQLFTVNVDMGVDTRPAASTDDISANVDYGRIYASVKKVVEENSFNLLETLAEHIADMLLEDDRVQTVRVEVEKNHALYEGQFFSASIAIERGR
ncbi:MAG: dihydroneopterin aldolase [Clostridiales bacterium]|nr:dihydroneopterin aldolase [Clostridiales bacterium]